MSENPRKKPDFLDLAKSQFAQIAAEFEKASRPSRTPERRKQMTSSYLDLLQKGLTRAQDSAHQVSREGRAAPEDRAGGDAPARLCSAHRSHSRTGGPGPGAGGAVDELGMHCRQPPSAGPTWALRRTTP